MSLRIHQQEHIETGQASALSQVAYCRQHKLNFKTFSNWLRIYCLLINVQELPGKG
jgi:hypothetical protein